MRILLAVTIIACLSGCVPVSVGANYTDEQGRVYGGSAAFGGTTLPAPKKFTK